MNDFVSLDKENVFFCAVGGEKKGQKHWCWAYWKSVCKLCFCCTLKHIEKLLGWTMNVCHGFVPFFENVRFSARSFIENSLEKLCSSYYTLPLHWKFTFHTLTVHAHQLRLTTKFNWEGAQTSFTLNWGYFMVYAVQLHYIYK